MIDGKKISVIVTTYRRYDTLGEVLQGWVDNEPDQLWVIDNSNKYRLEGRHYGKVTLFSMPIDLTTRIDYAFASLTDGDLVLLADDDFVAEPGLIEDLYNGWKSVGGIVGLCGRTFHGPNYKGDTKWYSSLKVTELQRTGSLGVAYFTPREYLGFDTRGMDTIDDDLFWLMNQCPKVPKHVVPTKKFRNLETCEDADCLFHAPKVQRDIRDSRYREYYLKNYKPYGKIY